MSEDKSHLINLSENYVHLKSDVVPDWVKNLSTLKAKIRAQLDSPTKEGVPGIKFVKPIDVPGQKQ